jgi:hypothetical protein
MIMEWILLGILLIVIIMNYSKIKEGMETPQDMTDSQQGQIISLYKQINTITMSEEQLKVIETDINTLSDQIFKLQENIE